MPATLQRFLQSIPQTDPMPRYFTRLVLAFLICSGGFIQNNARAAAKFTLSPGALTAYRHIMALRFDDAKLDIGQLKASEPDNYLSYYLENYILTLKIFIDEDEGELKQNSGKEDDYLRLLQKGDPQSPYFLYTQAQTRLLWAMNHAKFGAYFSAFNEAGEAYDELQKNQKKFPSFVANKLGLGVLHSIVGSIPGEYKWGVKLLSGMDGTVQQGQNEIESALEYAKTHDFAFEQEASVMYAFLMLHLKNDNDNAWNVIANSKLRPQESVLACFAVANVAMRTGRNDKAIETLERRPADAAYYPMVYLEYMLGQAKMSRGDADAETHIRHYIDAFKGRNYIKEAWQRLGWIAILKGDEAGYRRCMEKCKTQGYASVGGDKNALKEAKNGIPPDPLLLRARLLFDGGYYQKAYELLKPKRAADFNTDALQLEYTYRTGRILQLIAHPNEAIAAYLQTIDLGRDKKFYYACNAALQLGLIYEQYGNTAKAREYYTYCLRLKPDDYADALHTKAKAGLSRVK